MVRRKEKGWRLQRDGERERARAGAPRRWAWWLVRAFPIHPREALRGRAAGSPFLAAPGLRRAPLPPPPAAQECPRSLPFGFVFNLSPRYPRWLGPQGRGEDEEVSPVPLGNKSPLPFHAAGTRSALNTGPRLRSISLFI